MELPEKKFKIDFRVEVQVEPFLGQWIDSTIALRLKIVFLQPRPRY